MYSSFRNIFYFVIIISLIFYACEKDDVALGGPQFNIDLFEQYIVDSMNASGVGYAYAINQNQGFYSKGASGFAVRGDLVEQVLFTPDLRIHVASVSKTFTAAALLRILATMDDVTIDSTVSKYFPNHWILGPNIYLLTFRDLLTHKSAFSVSGGQNTYLDLQNLIQKGLDETKRGKDEYQDYKNHNYALFRIILPILTGKIPKTVTEPNGLALAWSYMQIIHEQLLHHMEIDSAFCHQLSNVRLKYYNCTWDNIASGGDNTLNCGAYGWNFSAPELAAFMAYLRYDNDILNIETRQLMDDLSLGWENERKSLVGDHGTYIFHGGQYHYGDSTAGGLKTIIIKFPNNKVEASLVMNCVDHPNSKIAKPRHLMRAAYDAAWK